MLEVKGLEISFSQYTKGLRRKDLTVITGLELSLSEGEVLAVVGASGSGKSLLAHAVLGILPSNASAKGEIIYKGEALTQERKEALRGKELALVPQSVNFLDPLQKVGRQIQSSMTGADKEERMLTLLLRYGLGREVAGLYPHQLSGGMARKVLLCAALAADCRIIIADEPTPGLDEHALAEVLFDFRAAADEGRSILMITHDINAALRIADRIAIFYGGTTVEIAAASDFLGDGRALRHPYSKALLEALPDREFLSVDGNQPLPGEFPSGCIFSGRCERRTDDCEKPPKFRDLRGGKVRCVHAT